MSERLVGVFELGWEPVEVYVDFKSSGGTFTSLEGTNKLVKMVIGVNEDNWFRVLDIIIHESTELAITRKGARYCASGTITKDHSVYLFSFSHPVFSDICCIVADFLSQVYDIIKDLWSNRNTFA
jgi:hypothetical protein